MDGCEAVTEEFTRYLISWYNWHNNNSNNNLDIRETVDYSQNNGTTITRDNNTHFHPFILKRLSISGCRNITPQVLQELRETCTQLEVIKVSLYERIPRDIIAKTVRLAQSSFGKYF